MIEFAGRTVIPTTLDPIPPLFRTVPGYITLNGREVASLKAEYDLPRGSARPVFKHLIAIVQDADDREEIQRQPRKKQGRRKRG